MKPDQCLFFLESNECDSTVKDEHIIQQGLGGSLHDNKIICGKCNNFFSRDIDTQLVTLYEPIIKILAPIIPGKVKKKKKKSKLLAGENDQYSLEYTKGTASLSGIRKNLNSNGQLEIVAPSTIPFEQLEAISESEGYDKIVSKKISLITEHFSNAREPFCFDVNGNVIRAILVDILELACYRCSNENLANIAKHPSLRDLRLWIRTGQLHTNLPLRTHLFAPINDLLESLFEPSIFSHRVAFCYDHSSKALILVAQFVDTMPWVFIFENMPINSSSISILYKKALVDGADQLFHTNDVVFDLKNIKWRSFAATTRHANEFALTKWKQEYIKQQARAHYILDLRYDDYIKQRLEAYAGTSKNDASIDAVVSLIENRYKGSDHLEEIIAATREKAVKANASNAPSNMNSVELYRECLSDIRNKYGYPCILYQ